MNAAAHLSRGATRTAAIALAVTIGLLGGPILVSADDPVVKFYSCATDTGTLTGPIAMTPVACKKGLFAVQWNATGPTGLTGPTGPIGPIGPTGPIGLTGPTGPTGLQGSPGVPGEDGLDGRDGADGAPGPKGDKGDQGVPGPALSSLDQLDGIACTSPAGAGTVRVTVGADGLVSIRCVEIGGGGGGGDEEPPNCDDGLEFTIDAYVDGACVSTVDKSICNDGNPRTEDIADYSTGRCLHVNVQTDPANCGALGNAIPADGTNHALYGCVGGQTVITDCEPNYVDGDHAVANGCEIDLRTDPENCGSVGNAIPADGTDHANYACLSGEVAIRSCQSGWADGDDSPANGCEIDVMTDPANCGAVGNAVPADGTNHANYTCSGGRTVITSCATDWADADNNPANGCETFSGDLDPTGNTQATAVFLGDRTCVDFPPIGFAGAIAGPGDHDWFRIRATGGSCLNDYFGQLSAPSGIGYDVLTNLNQRTNLSGSSTFTGPLPFYTSGTDVFIHVHALPFSVANGSYTLNLHL